MKRIIPGIIVLTLILNTVTAFGAGYIDLPDKHWAHKAVSNMSEQGVVKGYNDGSFKPGNTVTYSEFIKMAVIAAGNEDPGNSTVGHWAKNYYDLAVDNGYFTEFDIPKNQLDMLIPRGDMALIISNILGDIDIENYTELENSVSDVDYKTENDYDIIKTYASGIITGYTDGTFNPKGTLNRAESATVIYRLTDESKRVMPKVKTEEEIEKGYTLTNISDVIKDMSVLKEYDERGRFYGDFSDEVEVYDSADQFDIRMQMEWSEDWGSAFRHNLAGFNVFLMTDGKLVELTETSDSREPNENGVIDYYDPTCKVFFISGTGGLREKNSDIRDIDYIVAVPACDKNNKYWENTKVIPNPLKK